MTMTASAVRIASLAAALSSGTTRLTPRRSKIASSGPQVSGPGPGRRRRPSGACRTHGGTGSRRSRSSDLRCGRDVHCRQSRQSRVDGWDASRQIGATPGGASTGGSNDDGHGTHGHGRPLHRRRRGALGIGAELRVDRPVDRARDRPGRVRRGRGCRSGGGRRAGRLRVGRLVEGVTRPSRRRHAPPGRAHPSGRRPHRRHRVARHGQAPRPGHRRGPPRRRLPDLLRRTRRAAERHHLPRRRRLLRLLSPRAVWRRRRHQPVELPVPARLLEDRAGARRRQFRRAQDGRADTPLHRGAGSPDA